MHQIKIDWRQLHLYSGGDVDFESEILTLFIEHTKTQLLKLHQAWAIQDFQTIAFLSHQIKGACGNIGAETLHQRLSDLEQLTQTQDVVALEQLLHLCTAAFQDIVTEVQRRPSFNSLPADQVSL